MNPAATPQPPPAEGGEMVLFQVIEDLKARAEFGRKKHGCYLMTNNGRSAAWDKYQELLDAVMYARQELMEDAKRTDSTYLAGMIDGNIDVLMAFIAANEEWKKEVNAQLAYLSTNIAYMASRQGTKPLRISGYPRTEE